MIDLERIPEYRLSRQQIKSIATLKDSKKDQIIFHIGKSNEDLISLINSHIFSPINFKGYYTEKLLVSENRKIRKIIQRPRHYKEFLEKVDYRLDCRNDIKAYKNKNIFYDLTPIANINSEASRKARLVKIREFFDLIFKHISSSSYKYKAVVFNVDNLNVDDKNDYLNYFILALTKKYEFMVEYFKDITFIFVSPKQKTFFRFVFSEETFRKKPMILTRLKALKNITPIEDILKADEEGDNTVISANNTEKTSRFEKALSHTEVIEEKKETKKDNIRKTVVKNLGISNTGRDEDDQLLDNINSEIENTVEKINDNDVDELTEEDLMNIMTQKEEFKKSLLQAQNQQLNGYHKMNAEQLRREQDKLSFMDVSLKDIERNYKEKSIDKEEIGGSNTGTIINKEIKTSTLKSYDDSYMKKKFNKDIANVLKSFNDDKDIGMFVKDIKLTQNNTDMSKQSLLEVEFKDDSNTTHKFKVNIPEVKDGKFMYINGSKKVIMKQITFMPIVKLEPDRVQITTNYNKHFLMRFGQKFSEKLEYLKKLFLKTNLTSFKKAGCKLEFKYGNSLKDNSKYIATAEYNDISKYLYSLDIDRYHFIFNQKFLMDSIDPTKNSYDEKLATKSTYDKKLYFILGYTEGKKEIIISNIMDKMVYLYDGKNYSNLEQTLSSFIINLIQDNTEPDKLNKATSGKIKTSNKLTYSRIEINNKKIPLAILLAYEIGLLNLLNRYEIEYEFDSKNKSIHVQDDIGKIKFKDGYLYYDNSKIRNSILLSGLLEMDCEQIIFADMNEQEPYLDFFQDVFNSRNAAKGFHNTLTLMIDPITKDILEELNQPTNVYDVLLYANTLLEDVSYTEPSDVSNFRIRGAEQIPAMLYKVYADAFKHYKDSKHAKNPIKVTVDPDILTKKLMELKTIESYSSLNPSLELERMGTASMKGLSGINVNEAYTKRVRAYNDNMIDLVSLNTPEGNQVGIVKQLTYDPKISNIYGFIDANKKGNGSTTQYDFSELINVSTTTHSDPPRISMQSVQQKHIISIKDQDPLLIGSGVEKMAPYMISDEFAFKAKEDGKIEKIDYKNEVAILRYKSGKADLVDLAVSECNNSNGGFFISQKLEMLYGVGETFTKGAVIAKNPLFFSGNGKNEDLSYNLGKLTKVAIASGDFTLEDSSCITETLSEKMASKITMRKTVVLDTNATVSFVAKEGQYIKTGEPLIVFENAFDDDSINDILGKIGSEYAEDIAEISKNELKCKYTGRVVKINIYYASDISAYSKSIQTILNDYIAKGKSRKKAIESIKGNGYDSVNAPIIEKQTDRKIKGTEIGDGIMFEFFIEYEDKLDIGDKIIYGTALKTIVSTVIEKGEEPFSEFREDEPIEGVLSPLSINSRMTLDILIDGNVNKALIELKRKIKEIYES